MFMSLQTSCSFLLASNCELVPAFEREFTSLAVEVHATFAEAMRYLEHYLEDVCILEKNEKDHAVPVPGKQNAAFDAAKIKNLIEELCDPIFIRVSTCARSPHIPH